MEIAEGCLRPEGRFVLHTIGANISGRVTDAWTDKYIFPDSMLPSLRQLTAAAEGLLVREHNFAAGWDTIKERYGQRFFRMWRFYLLSSAGSFRARHNQLWQIVLSPRKSARVYESIRD